MARGKNKLQCKQEAAGVLTRRWFQEGLRKKSPEGPGQGPKRTPSQPRTAPAKKCPQMAPTDSLDGQQ
eukprot:3720317-Pyramimonas_sp.AAC.1